jgi:glutamate carboxypeptidase
MRSLRLALVLLAVGPFALVAQAAPAATLSPAERAIVASVDAHRAESLALLEQLVNINSGTHNFPGVRQVGDILRARFDALGFTTRWIDGTPFGRAGHLVAEHRGPGPRLLLIGHLDTVFEPSSPFQRFTRIDDSTATGPGIIDMKGGDVIMMSALTALREAGVLASMHVVVVMDGDEEEAGQPIAAARAALVEAATGATFALGFEDGAGDPRSAVVSRRGATEWTLRTTGHAGHASQIFGAALGAGAVFEASRILHDFYRELGHEPLLAFSPGLVLAGSELSLGSAGTSGSASGKRNVVSRQAVVTGDMRTISPAQLAHAQAAMRAIVARHLPGTDASIAFDDAYPPMSPSEGNRRLLARYDRASRDIGAGPVVAVDPARAGAADISFVAALVPMKLDGIGLSGHDDHSATETADLRMLTVQAKRAALVMARVSRLEGTRP